MDMQWLSNRMDEAVAAMQQQRDLEGEVALLIRTASSLIEKVEQRNREIAELRTQLEFARDQLAALRTELQARYVESAALMRG
jgi:predicted  nucleic acid-binding Zn-ribbon protein